MSSTHGITFRLPNDPLAPLDPTTKPSSVAVRRHRRELYHNAMAVKSALGRGDHGHLGSLMPEAEYIKISKGAQRYITPTEPAIPDLSRESNMSKPRSTRKTCKASTKPRHYKTISNCCYSRQSPNCTSAASLDTGRAPNETIWYHHSPGPERQLEATRDTMGPGDTK
jgi:hypothetical protein